MADVIADRVKVILEAQDDASVKVKAYGATVEQTAAKVEKSASRAEKAVDASAAAQARALERAAIAAEKAAAREVRAQEEAARKIASARKRQALTIQQTLNDVIASGASGNINPLTILAQQGGQVTEAFGGLGNTLKALGPVAFSAGGALTAMGVALGAAVFAADKFDSSNKDLMVSVTGLGARAGLTVDQLKSIAAASADAGNVSTAAAEKMATAYINTGRIGGEVTEKLIAITDDYARVAGVDAKDAVLQLAAAFSDRTGKAALELLDRFGALDTKTKDLITTMIANGDLQGAQVIAVNRLTEAFGRQAENVGNVEKAIRRLKGLGGNIFTGVRDFFSPSTDVEDSFAGFNGGRLTSTQQATADARARKDQQVRRDRGLAGQAIIDQQLHLPEIRTINGQISQLEANLRDGIGDAKSIAKTVAKLKKDRADLEGIEKPTGSGGTRRTTPKKTGPEIRGVAGLVADPDQTYDLTKIRAINGNNGGLANYIKNGGDNFQAAGEGFRVDDETLRRNEVELYDSTYTSIAYGLDAAFRDGVPGLAQYLGDEMRRSLVSSLAKGLTDLITQSNGGGGNIFSAIGSAIIGRFGGGSGSGHSSGNKIFGRASGGNMVGGHPYLVNEGRPEVFVPPVSGKMVPVGRMGSSGQTVVNATFAPVLTVGAGADAREVALLRSDLAKMKASFKSDVTNVVNDGVQRRTIRTGGN